MRYWVYILKCADGAYYIGSHRGESRENRASEHNDGLDPNAWTYSRRPVELVWTQEFQRPQDAIAVERQMKGWTRQEGSSYCRAMVCVARACGPENAQPRR
jgi:putative endonuclease